MLDKLDPMPIIRIAQTYPLSEKGAQLSFETYVPQDIAREEIDKIVDKLELVAGRQAIKGQLVVKKEELEHIEKMLSQITDDYHRINNEYERKELDYRAMGRTGRFKLTSKEEMDKKNTETTMRKLVDTRIQIQEQIKGLEFVVNGA